MHLILPILLLAFFSIILPTSREYYTLPALIALLSGINKSELPTLTTASVSMNFGSARLICIVYLLLFGPDYDHFLTDNSTKLSAATGIVAPMRLAF
jgi:hypothetical protein